MSKAPYIPLYTSDFIAGTSGMTASTKGVYITLLCLMYEGEAPLAQSWENLARRCGCTLPAFRKAIEDLEADGKLLISDDGLWSHKCDKHITARRERQSSASSAAKKRWEKTQQNQCEVDADALPAQCQPEPEPEPYNISSSKTMKDIDIRFDEFWDCVPRKVGKGAARKAWRAAVKKADADEIIAGMVRYFEEQSGKDPKFIAHPATWLNGERWSDEPVKQVANSNRETEAERIKRIENAWIYS